MCVRVFFPPGHRHPLPVLRAEQDGQELGGVASGQGGRQCLLIDERRPVRAIARRPEALLGELLGLGWVVHR
ncbi:MAG: hypothetical protein JWL99_822 [Streptomyces oryziradicis]|nr:hypothetical protein [Actinacidiphila oryziradicis]